MLNRHLFCGIAIATLAFGPIASAQETDPSTSGTSAQRADTQQVKALNAEITAAKNELDKLRRTIESADVSAQERQMLTGSLEQMNEHMNRMSTQACLIDPPSCPSTRQPSRQGSSQ